MGIGLFGKLPAKGDFLVHNLPKSILNPFETWMESAISGSREMMEDSWQDYYVNAPTWRFWIGPDVFGTACCGVWMPSHDKVGRRFPLTIIHSAAEEGALVEPPVLDDNDGWFAALEAGLAEVQSSDGEVASILEALEAPATMPENTTPAHAFWAHANQSDIATLLKDASATDHRLASTDRTYWWTKGVENTNPVLVAQQGMPDGAAFSLMLQGVHQIALANEAE